jgi:subtilase family serine protease
MRGDYIFSQVKLGAAARLIAATSGVPVFVENTLVANSDVTIRPSGQQPAADLFISVTGSDASLDDRGTSSRPTVVFGPRSKIRAIVSAPHGTLAMDDHVEATGAFAGFDVRLADHIHVDFQSGIPPAQADQHGQQQLSGYFAAPTDPSVMPVVGPVPSSTEIPLTISLPVRNAAALDTLASQVSDPTSPNFRKYLTVDQFTTTFGPSAADYNALVNWAHTVGFDVGATHQNNVLISVRATAAQIERALFANLVYRLRRDGSRFATVDRDPSLDFNVPILRISGLNEVIPPTPGSHHDASAGFPDPGSGPGGLFGGNDFRAAYVSGATEIGNGQTLALVEFDDFFPGDVAAYRNQFGLPNVPVQKKTFDNFSGPPGNNNVEVTLDIDMAMSMAPGLDAIVLYEGQLANSIYGALASPDGTVLPLQVSASWNYTVDSTTQQLLKEMAVQGQSVFVSAGDCGAYPVDPNDDRDMPFTTVVGGTTLAMSGKGISYSSETAWRAGGGGILTNGPQIPSYQSAIAGTNGASNTFRNLPDVSAVASGVASAQNGTGNLTGVVGTSIATPLWAAFTALANERAEKAGKGSVGFANPVIYTIGGGTKYATNFNDVCAGATLGFTAAFCGNPTQPQSTTPPICPNSPSFAEFFAGTGYDLVTGWGSPQAALLTNLSQALANIQSVTMIIGTGNDNARSDTELQATLPGVPTICLKPSNNADPDSVCPNGGSAKDEQGNQEWKNFTTSTQTFSFPASVPAPSLTTLQIKLFEHNNGTETEDNWDIQNITVIATDTANNTAPLLNVGNPPNGDNCIVRLTGKTPAFTFNLSQANPTGANPTIPPGSCPQSQ